MSVLQPVLIARKMCAASQVLHALLEAGGEEAGQCAAALDYAVVGISNWALDHAKRNRAILLVRS